MPLIIDLGLTEEANKLGLGSFDPKLYRLVKGNAKTENYSILTRVLLKAGPRPTGRDGPAARRPEDLAAHGPRRPGGQVLIFHNFFVRRQIHAHAQICIWFGRANFEFGTILIIVWIFFDPFFQCLLLSEKCCHSLFIRLLTEPYREEVHCQTIQSMSVDLPLGKKLWKIRD